MAHKNIDSWLNAYQNFTEEDQRIALERLIDKSTHKNIRFMRDGRENREKYNYVQHFLINLPFLDVNGSSTLV